MSLSWRKPATKNYKWAPKSVQSLIIRGPRENAATLLRHRGDDELERQNASESGHMLTTVLLARS